MQTSASDASASAQAIREGLATAIHRFRARDATRRLWRAAPVAAGAALASSAVAWGLGWPAVAPLAVLITGTISLLAWFLRARRSPPVTDPWAARIDADAGLGGELRSARWFAAADHRDEWADLHLIRAAQRCERVDWQDIYPAVRPWRPVFATLALAAATVALSAALPPGGSNATGSGTGAATGRQVAGHDRLLSAEGLPPELLEQLPQLLAAAEAGDRAAVDALSRQMDLVDLVERLAGQQDRALLDAVARALTPQATVDAADALADRSRRAADSAAMSAAMRDALERLADELEVVAPEQAAAPPQEGTSSSDSAAADGSGQSAAKAPGDQLTIQFARETDAGGGTGVMLLSEQEATSEGSAPGAGFGGAQTPDAPATPSQLDAALRREVIAAHEEAPGAADRVEIHRRTEQTRATAAFTGSATGRFDTAAVAAPPPVPEARRSGLRSYFVRSAQ